MTFPREGDARRGAWLVGVSAVIFGAIGVLVKHLTEGLPSPMVVFFRNAAGLAALLPFVLRSGWERAVPTRRVGSHLFRAAAGLSAMYLTFFAISRMVLADAYVLAYTAPLFMPFIAHVWLGERMPAHALPVAALGFLGVLLILKPGTGVFQPAAVAALAGGFLAAVAQVGIRQLASTEPSIRIVLYFAVAATLASAAPLPWAWTPPPLGSWAFLILVGLLATVAQLLMTKGYRNASPGRVGPLMYLAVGVAGVADWALWRRMPDPWSLAGIALIAGAGAWILRLSRRPAPALDETVPLR